jgi:hypothetical protein
MGTPFDKRLHGMGVARHGEASQPKSPREGASVPAYRHVVAGIEGERLCVFKAAQLRFAIADAAFCLPPECTALVHVLRGRHAEAREKRGT